MEPSYYYNEMGTSSLSRIFLFFSVKKKITLVTSSSFLLFRLPSYTIIRLNCQLPSYGPSDFPFLVLVSSFLHRYICSNHVGVGSRSVDDYHYPVGLGITNT